MQPNQQQAQGGLASSIVNAGAKAFSPNSDETERQLGREELNELLDGAATWPLVQALNALIRPGVVPEYLQGELIKVLIRVPLRPDGMRATLEFIFSVHPSSAQWPEGTDGTSPQKQGASITTEALAMATKLLCTPPQSMAPTAWFESIRPQLMSLLDGREGPELVRVASSIICSGLLSKRQFGAPGSPGWNVFVHPILKCINPLIAGEVNDVTLKEEDTEGVIHLTENRIICSSQDLSQALQRLKSLLLSSPYPAQCRRVIRLILLPLWTLSSWEGLGQRAVEAFCAPARSLLQTYMKLVTQSGEALYILRNLLRNGNKGGGAPGWEFQVTANNQIQVVQHREHMFTGEDPPRLDISVLTGKSKYFVELLLSSWSAGEVSNFFFALLDRCLLADDSSETAGISVKYSLSPELASEPAVEKLLEMSVLQSMMEIASEKLIDRFHRILELICRVFEADSTRSQPEEVLTVTLSLLNLVITAPTFSKRQLPPEMLGLIEKSLDRFDRQHQDSISTTARNLGLLLRYRDDMDDGPSPASQLNDPQAENKKTYSLAMSYVLDTESPPPVKIEGLNLLSGLIRAGSPVLDITAVLTLLSTLTRNEDDSLNSFVVKMYTQVASRHPKSVCDELVELYVDAKETLNTDSRLRFGEALLQVIERLGETFTGEVAKRVGEALLSVAGRRGHRPKTETWQAREERMKAMKDKEAKEAWGGEVLDMSDSVSPDQQAANEILAQIVEGWESKRGAEDIRMRSSALSIFAASIESNLAGIGHTSVSSAVDTSINILTLEPELEKGILRRAAVVLVFRFISSLDKARREGRRLGFSLVESSRESIQRVMSYISATDNDGLVREHARDVIENLEDWHIAKFFPDDADVSGGDPVLKSIQGISIDPLRLNGQSNGRRPVIEELD